jgi:hypothetical protein
MTSSPDQTAPANAGQAMEFTLKDAATGKTRQVTVEVEENSLGLAIHPEGTGVYDGPFAPIFLELYDGQLRLLIWDNVNEQEPKIIELSRTFESERKIVDG